MKKALFLLVLAISFAISFAGYVGGYTKSNGTYVKGYYRSDANSTVKDNYSYYGNTNPYTGKVGTNKYKSSYTSDYYDGSTKKSKNWWD